MTPMMRCAKPGASNINRILWACVLWVGLALALPAHASELGNIFAKGANQKSRIASARALEGLEAIFEGLRQREIGNVDAGQKAFSKATEALGSAAVLMQEARELIKTDFTINWDLIDRRNRRILERFVGEAGLPKTEQALYDVFINATFDLQKDIDAVPHRGHLSVLPIIANRLTGYIRLGAAVTSISRQLNPSPSV